MNFVKNNGNNMRRLFNTNKSQNSYILPPILVKYKPMIQEWNLSNVPTFNKSINYGDEGKLTFPARSDQNPFLPTKIIVKVEDF